MATETYRGSCHCGKVRFEAEIDLSAGAAKCNCTICAKTRNWCAMVKPEAFHLRNGEEDLMDYQYGRNSLHHLFCKHCGVRSFARGHSDAAGGDFVTVRLACLDEVDPKLLAESPVRYADGLNDNWWNPPSETRHL